jgi:crotonobetaine/carnitine-CoA ligase
MTFRIPYEERHSGRILADRAARLADRPFLTIGGRAYTYGETFEHSQAIARGLKDLGVTPQQPVIIMLDNSAQFIFSWFALMLLNAIGVPVNTAYAGDLLAYVIRDSGATFAITDTSYASAFAQLPLEQRAALKGIVVGGTGEVPAAAGFVREGDMLVPRGATLLAQGAPSDASLICYTSGTTGPSKGVVLPHSHNLQTVETCINSVGIGADDVIFSPLPLFHGMSRTMGTLPALALGAQIHLGRRFSATSFWQEIRQAQATVSVTIFTIPPILKAKPPAAQDRDHRLRVMFNAHHDLEFEERFGARIVEAHGMTEVGITIHTPYPERKLGAAGRAAVDWDVALVDENDNPVPVGRDGELVVRPKKPGLIMNGYLNKPELTLAACRNLWFHSGDLMRQDEDGYFYFAGRKKERIRRRGENISSYDIESAVEQHPAMVEAAAIGVPAGDGEDDVYLVVVPREPGSVTETALCDWLATRLPKFMVPRYIEFRDTLPKTGSGKVEKYRLAENLDVTGAWDSQRASATTT